MSEHVTSRAVAPIVLAVGTALVLLLAGAVAQPGLADEDEESITIEREGGELNITVDESAVETFDNVTVQINDSDDSDSWDHSWDNETFDEQIDLFDPPGNDPLPDELADATIEVTLLNETDGTSQVDSDTHHLYAISESEDDPDVEDGELTVPVDDVVGTDTVAVDVTGDDEADAEVDADGSGDTQLSIPLETVREADVTGEIDIVAFPAGEAETASAEEAETTLATLDPTELVETTVTVDGSALVLEYPLITADGGYSVGIDADSEEAVNVEVEEAGVLNLSSAAETEWFSGSETLTVFADGETLDTTAVTLTDNGLEWVRDELIPEESIRYEDGLLEYPLLFEGQTYGVVIETRDGELTLWGEANGDGLGLPDRARALLVGSDVSISVFDEDRRPVLEGELLDEQEPEELWLEDQQLNVTGSNHQFTNVEQIWLGHNGTVTQLGSDEIDEDAGLIDLSGLDTEPAVNDTLGVVVDYQTGAPASLNVNVGEPPSETSTAFFVGTPFLTAWLVGGVLLLLVLGVSSKIRFPVIGQPSAYGIGLGVLTVAHLLVLSMAAYSINQLGVVETAGLFTPLLVVGGAVLVTLLVLSTYVVFRRQPRDLNTMLLAGVAGVIASALFVGAGVAEESVVWLGIGGLYGTVAGETFAWWDGRHVSKKRQQSVSASTSPTKQPVDVTVRVVDRVTGNALGSETDVTATQSNTMSRESLPVRNGQATGSLKPGWWTFSTTVAGQQVEQERKVSTHNDTVRLEVPGNEVTVQVRTDDGQVLENAAVTVAGESIENRGSTDRRGVYETTLPARTTDVELSAEHELYEPVSEPVNARHQTDPVTLRLTPRVGSLTVKASLERDAVSGVSVTATRQDRDGPDRTVSGTTDSRGTVEFTGLLIGRYDLDVDLPATGRAFSVTAGSAEIREGTTERRDVTITFEYALARQHKQRVRELRGELQDIARSSRRDDAIQRYYASVLHSVLDEVERVPQSGYTFLEYNQDPDAVVEALLDAIAEAVETMDEVLSSQRNVNLFSACSDLPDANVEWQGAVDISTLLQDASRDVGQQRADVNTQLERVDEQITAELRELAEVSPAREMWDGVRDLLRDQSGLDEMEVAASIFVATLMLDAIESVFEHRKLRKRLEQTVY